MSNSLTSHEDLTPYIEQLARINHSAAYQLERRRSFTADPETIIKELLTEVMSCRKSVTQCTNIAEKFLEAYQTSTEDIQRIHDRTKLLEHELGEQSTKIQKYQKELETKDKRLDSLTLEATDMERILKISNQDCNKMKKEIDALKKELSQKEQSTAIRENTIQQRQKLFVEENREKEIDKSMQIKYDSLNTDYKKKIAEIDALKNKNNEYEGLFNAERAGFEKMSSLNNQLRNEISIQKVEMINFKEKYSQMKDRVKDLKEEIIQLRLNNESLEKELDYSRARRESVVSVARESLEIHEDIVDIIRGTTGQNKPENLGAFMNELEDKGKNFGSEPFFMISPQGTTSPKFILCQTKKIEKHEGFLIEPVKKNIQLVKNTGFVYENIKNHPEKNLFNIQKCEDFNVKINKKNLPDKIFKTQKCEDFNVKTHKKDFPDKIEKCLFRIQKCEDFNVKTHKKEFTDKIEKHLFRIQKCEDFNVKTHKKELPDNIEKKSFDIQKCEDFNVKGHKKVFPENIEKNSFNIQKCEDFNVKAHKKHLPDKILKKSFKIQKCEDFIIKPNTQNLPIKKRKIQFKIQKCEDLNVKTHNKNLPEKKSKNPLKIQKFQGFTTQIHTKKLNLKLFKGFNYIKKLKMGKVENNFYIKPAIFHFDDSVSVTSNETEATPRSRRMSVIENRDPIKQFFYYQCQAAKINSAYRDIIGELPISKLYEKVMKQGVPFNMWNDYISEYISSTFRKRAKNKVL
ncbi:hypothetical protein SteCoe_24989 [Stentor coeruleus]|uniref:Uncharacterized protein n=1 Tax=Stentor coeruleus TaxID=5963 RepID=A0A1R2BGB6_9CILI|nr:hypothetical protein SteCoe_24989 [Stentor coeruleus]